MASHRRQGHGTPPLEGGTVDDAHQPSTVWHIYFTLVTEKKRDTGGALQGHREVTRATNQAPFAPLELAAGSPSHRLSDLYSRNLNRPENLGDPTGIMSRPTTTP